VRWKHSTIEGHLTNPFVEVMPSRGFSVCNGLSATSTRTRTATGAIFGIGIDIRFIDVDITTCVYKYHICNILLELSKNAPEVVVVTLKSSVSNEALVDVNLNGTSDTANMGCKVITNIIWEWLLCDDLVNNNISNHNSKYSYELPRHPTQSYHPL
jgi:hypothetical protein